jgi:O-antigen/teichoic acid export membrane protein
LYLQALRLSGTVSVMVACAVMFLADNFALLFVSAQYAPAAAGTMRILVLIYAGQCLCATSAFFAVPLERPGLNARWALAGSFAMCVLMFVLGSQFGLAGAAWANAGYLLTVFITIELAPEIGATMRDLIRVFVLPLAIATGCWLLSSSAWYRALSPVWHVLAGGILTPVLVFLSAGWMSPETLRSDLPPVIFDRFAPLFRWLRLIPATGDWQ